MFTRFFSGLGGFGQKNTYSRPPIKFLFKGINVDVAIRRYGNSEPIDLFISCPENSIYLFFTELSNFEKLKNKGYEVYEFLPEPVSYDISWLYRVNSSNIQKFKEDCKKSNISIELHYMKLNETKIYKEKIKLE
jgi:hypothetical protein